MLTSKAIRKSRIRKMPQPVKLTEDEIGELVLIALGDDELCDAIEEHERRLLALKGGRDPYADQLEAPNVPMIARKISRLVDRHYARGADIDTTDLVLALRSAVLDQMVLPPHLIWDCWNDTKH
jgi:hypothetical protein